MRLNPARPRMAARLAACALALAAPAFTARAAAQHTVSLLVDGRDEMRISNGSLTVKHL